MGSVLLICFYDQKRLLSFAWSHTHTHIYIQKPTSEGVSLFEPVTGHLSGRAVGPGGAASIVRETVN